MATGYLEHPNISANLFWEQALFTFGASRQLDTNRAVSVLGE